MLERKRILDFEVDAYLILIQEVVGGTISLNRIYLIRPNLDYCGERPANRSLILHLHIQMAGCERWNFTL